MKQIKKIAITNEKGGVGKTMTAVNLSACLAQRGYRVLLIDADPQGYATLNYDVDVSPSLLEVLRGQVACTKAVQTTRFGVDVLPSDRTLSVIEEDLIRQKMNGAPYLNTLEKALEDLPDYDFVIIDCPPQGGRLMDIVHYYADAIIMPMFAEDYGIHALTLKAEAIADIRRTINPNLKILGGLITMDERRGLRSVFREVLLGQDLLPMFNTTIRRNVALIRAVNAREPICVFDKRSNGNLPLVGTTVTYYISVPNYGIALPEIESLNESAWIVDKLLVRNMPRADAVTIAQVLRDVLKNEVKQNDNEIQSL